MLAISDGIVPAGAIRRGVAAYAVVAGMAAVSSPAAAYVVFPGVPAHAVRTVHAATPAELKHALDTATGPTEVLLAPGDWGHGQFANYNHPFDIVIRSASGTDRAVFSRLSIRNSSNLRLERITMQLILGPGEGDHTTGAMIRDSHNISISRSNFLGNMNGSTMDDGLLLRLMDSSRILLFNNHLEESRAALGIVNVSYSSVFANRIRLAREGVDIAGVRTLRLERNYISHIIPLVRTAPTGAVSYHDHADAFQIFTDNSGVPSYDVLFQSNAMLTGSGTASGLHVSSNRDLTKKHKKIWLRHNVIFSRERQGLWIAATEGAVVDRNTIVTAPNFVYEPAMYVHNAKSVLIRSNIYPMYLGSGDNITLTNNVDMQDFKGGAGPTPASQFTGNIIQPDPPLAAFTIRPGSDAAKQNAGARLSPGVGGFSGTDAQIEAEFQSALTAMRAL